MKLFAIITACLMATGGAAYYMNDCGSCSSSSVSCPIAPSGGCCLKDKATGPSCCEVPCPDCANNCVDCCDICETCCAAIQSPVNTKVTEATQETEEFCPHCVTPARLATTTATAGISLK